MNEVQFAYKIRQHLNGGLREIRAATSDRLAAARQCALTRQKSVVRQSVLAATGGFFLHSFDNLGLKQLVLSLALVVCVISSTFWIADQRVAELGAIDSELLADDLPIAAFTDKGFDTWLRRAAAE